MDTYDIHAEAYKLVEALDNFYQDNLSGKNGLIDIEVIHIVESFLAQAYDAGKNK